MSELTINNAIVHHLVKEQYKPIQPIVYRDKVLDAASEVVHGLIMGVLKAYGTKNNRAHYGVFAEGDAGKFFPAYFKKYHDSSAADENKFMALCKNAMKQLYWKAESEHLASGGYVLFADYDHQGVRFFLIAMIKEKAGISISSNLEPETLIRLDFERLHQAARINFSKYNEFSSIQDTDAKSQINYLNFISGGSSGAAGYFVTALGCSRGTTSDRATKTLIIETVKYFRNHSTLKYQKNNFKRSLIEYLHEKETNGDSVRLSEVGQIISSHIPHDLGDDAESIVEEIITSLNSEENGVPVEFPVSRNELLKQTHIKLNAGSWRAEFDRQLLGAEESAPVYYNREVGSLTFNKIPSTMIQIIEEELLEKKIPE